MTEPLNETTLPGNFAKETSRIRDISERAEYPVALAEVLTHLIKQRPGELTYNSRHVLSAEAKLSPLGGTALFVKVRRETGFDDETHIVNDFNDLRILGGVPIPVAPWVQLPDGRSEPDLQDLFTDPRWQLPLIVKLKSGRQHCVTSVTINPDSTVSATGHRYFARGVSRAKKQPPLIKCPDGQWRTATACGRAYPNEFDPLLKAFRPGVVIPALGVRLKPKKPKKIKCPDGKWRSSAACSRMYGEKFDKIAYRFVEGVVIPGPVGRDGSGNRKRILCPDGKRRWAVHVVKIYGDCFDPKTGRFATFAKADKDAPLGVSGGR